jgi:hypothetical protein
MGVTRKIRPLPQTSHWQLSNYNFDGGEFSKIGRITMSTLEQRICMDAGEVMGGGGSASDEKRDDLQPYFRLPDGFAVSKGDR